MFQASTATKSISAWPRCLIASFLWLGDGSLYVLWGKAGQGWGFVVLDVSGSSKRPPWKYPLVLRAVKILSGLEIIITGDRSNFSETISSTPETSLLTFSSFVVHLLSRSICIQHLAWLPILDIILIIIIRCTFWAPFHPRSPEHFYKR